MECQYQMRTPREPRTADPSPATYVSARTATSARPRRKTPSPDPASAMLCSYLATFGGHEGSVFAVAIDPSGKYVGSTSSDRTARVWPVRTPTKAGHTGAHVCLRGHTDVVTSLAFRPTANAGSEPRPEGDDGGNGDALAFNALFLATGSLGD